MKLKRIFPLFLSALFLTGCIVGQPAPLGYRQISMDEAREIMKRESGYLILDVRTPAEFAGKHIPNAVNLPNEEIGNAEIPLLPDKTQKILVYCRSGRRSKEAAAKLVALGYTNVLEFGGINDWRWETVSGR